MSLFYLNPSWCVTIQVTGRMKSCRPSDEQLQESSRAGQKGNQKGAGALAGLGRAVGWSSSQTDILGPAVKVQRASLFSQPLLSEALLGQWQLHLFMDCCRVVLKSLKSRFSGDSKMRTVNKLSQKLECQNARAWR